MQGIEDVDILNQTERDIHGDRTFVVAGTLRGCLWSPNAGFEENYQQDRRNLSGTLYHQGPRSVTPSALSQVRFRSTGETWEIENDPQDWRPALGNSVAGLVLRLRATKG